MIELRERPADPRQRLGRAGEAAAEAALEAAGIHIVERRFRCRRGEIDLIGRDRGLVVFVEVKARRGIGYGSPAEAVAPGKRNRLARVALEYLARRGLLEERCRFDVVEVMANDRGDPVSVRHVADAFRLWPRG